MRVAGYIPTQNALQTRSRRFQATTTFILHRSIATAKSAHPSPTVILPKSAHSATSPGICPQRPKSAHTVQLPKLSEIYSDKCSEIPEAIPEQIPEQPSRSSPSTQLHQWPFTGPRRSAPEAKQSTCRSTATPPPNVVFQHRHPDTVMGSRRAGPTTAVRGAVLALPRPFCLVSTPLMMPP